MYLHIKTVSEPTHNFNYSIAAESLVRYFCENTTTSNPNLALFGQGKDKVIAAKTDEKVESLDEPTTCCMSGCANCVWLDYAEKLSQQFKDGGERAVQEINDRVSDPNIRAFLLHEIRMRNKSSVNS